jgi:hypothetical protein
MTPERDFRLVRGQLQELLSVAMEATQLGEDATRGFGRMAAERCHAILQEHRDTLHSEGEKRLLEEVVWAIRKSI